MAAPVDTLALPSPTDTWEEWTLAKPPNDLEPLRDYYESKGWGWHCKKCNQPATRGHTDGKRHVNMAWTQREQQGAVRAGYTAAWETTAGGGGGGGSWAAVAAAAAGNGAAGSSGCGSGGSGCAANPAIAAVGTQQLDRIEALLAKLVADMEQVKEQLDRIEYTTSVTYR